MEVNIAGVSFQNPVMTASGTFGSGAEYSALIDLNRLGAVVTKGVSHRPWQGNPTPRVCEVTGGMLNAVGLQNPGVDVMIERDLPFLRQFDTRVIGKACRSAGGYAGDQHILSECKRRRYRIRTECIRR